MSKQAKMDRNAGSVHTDTPSGGVTAGREGDTERAASDTSTKTRRPSVKYTNIVRSEYKPAPQGQTLNLLDERCEVIKGKVAIPGIVCKCPFGEPLILVPSTATAFREPTLRQLLNYLQSLDAK